MLPSTPTKFAVGILIMPLPLSVEPEVNDHVPVILPVVPAAPVVITLVLRLPASNKVVTLAFAILAKLLTLNVAHAISAALKLFVIVALFADKLPLTVTLPNVVLPFELDDNAIQLFATVSPSIGHIYIVWLFVLYQSCPRNGFGGGVLSAKFSSMCVKFVSNACPYPL